MSDSTNNDSQPEGAAERALREGLKVTALAPEALQRIRQATEQEWRAVTQAPASGRRRWIAAAASVAVVALSLGWGYFAFSSGSANGAILGEVANVDAPGIVESRLLREDLLFAAGSKLRAGQTLDVRGNSLVALEAGGNIRFARASAIEIRDASTVLLKYGELYVDIPPGAHANEAFRVVTEAGEFLHQGTQFAIAIVGDQTRLRVREGSVLWRANAGDSTVKAGTELTVDRAGKATQRPIPTAGHDWAWVDSMTPDFAIDNRPLLEFLQWFARESGRKLVIDEAARSQAAGIRMHGNVRGLTVTEALSAVMATTTLRYELPEGVIRVSSAGEKPPAH